MTYTTGELNGRTLEDFEQLASKQGECWCMFYQRATPIGRGLSSDERKRKNRKDKKALVRRGRSHAILVYDGQTPVGWCQYGRQDELPRIDARRTYRKAAPEVRVAHLWRITCFFVDRDHRGRGVAKVALHAALESRFTERWGIATMFPTV